jgi:hypothetical protein
MFHIKEYISEYYKISNENLQVINKTKSTKLKNLLSVNILSRELCILYNMKFFFYLVKKNSKEYYPFILISKYTIKNIKEIYLKYNKKIPKFKLLF